MDHLSRFSAIHSLLHSHQSYWRESPFCIPAPAWLQQSPDLALAMQALSTSDLAEMEADPARLQQHIARFLPALQCLPELLHLPAATMITELPTRWSTDVPGRKWAQISAFAAHVPASSLTLVDWCAGKSHLGRTIAALHQRPLRAIERDATLCREGTQMAATQQLHAQFVCADVLQEQPPLHADDQVLALHACGDLHRVLLRHWRQSRSPQLVLAPCCYHLWLKGDYQPLSQQAQQMNLQLNKNQVQLAIQETVTSSARVRQQVDQLAQWRLAFDVWQREARGIDEYLNTPSLPLSVLPLGIEEVFKRFATRHQLSLPHDLDFASYQRRGQQRFAEAKRLQLVRQAFRRALELYLVLDLALYLEEANCQVQLKTFCQRAVTPRNLLLIVERNE